MCLCFFMQLQTTSISRLLPLISVFELAFVPCCVYPSELCVHRLQSFSCLLLSLEEFLRPDSKQFQKTVEEARLEGETFLRPGLSDGPCRVQQQTSVLSPGTVLCRVCEKLYC